MASSVFMLLLREQTIFFTRIIITVHGCLGSTIGVLKYIISVSSMMRFPIPQDHTNWAQEIGLIFSASVMMGELGGVSLEYTTSIP
jgi:hypothetical protein